MVIVMNVKSVLIGLMCWLPATLLANNIDLSTVPPREGVQLTIYNSEDITLVRETRLVSFKRGMNPLQFSWANTLIDPTSVALRFPDSGNWLELLDTTYPHDKQQMLYWNVEAERAGVARVEISYFTSGLTWSADYTAISNQAEDAMHLNGFVRIRNKSGEDYEDAEVRLVVGTINLVEKIAQLARIQMNQVGKLKSEVRNEFKKRAARMMMEAASMDRAMPATASSPKQIIKQGLSEYFIYTIEGRETIPTGWSKRLRSFEGRDVPMSVEYRYRPTQYGDQLVRFYLLKNDQPSNLGESPLPNGRVQVLRENSVGGLSLIVSRDIQYVPIGDDIELNLGTDPRVVFELTKLKVWRDDIWMRVNGGSVYHRIGDAALRLELNSTVGGWNEHVLYAQRIRNNSGKPIQVKVRRSFPGDVVFKSNFGPTLHDYRTVEYAHALKVGDHAALLYEVITRNGRNQKKHQLELMAARVQLPAWRKDSSGVKR
ncbi:MAG: hypothetical protein BMS9Abin15_0261 [Gammaproteobacteria bacterium]|nr:MAG: hypothetical protein BMS9Abin15_0261 [Gammaproteobacteria bacterium]